MARNKCLFALGMAYALIRKVKLGGEDAETIAHIERIIGEVCYGKKRKKIKAVRQ